MTITIRDARHVSEASRRPQRLMFKTAEAVSGNGTMVALDEAEGIVTAIVSVTGTEDEVADIIEPGAYRQTLLKRRPKVCWAHSWERPIGRVLHIEELHPGDERLPAQTKDGQPWPSGAGALVATMQFNMRTQEGKDAFEAVRFYSETGECEYSIGYQVPPGKSTRDNAGVRHIKALELYELSVVLFGAHTMTGTISVKDGLSLLRKHAPGSGREALRRALERKAAGVTEETPPAAPAAAKPEAPAQPAAQPSEDDKDADGQPDFDDGVMVAVYPDDAAAKAVAKHAPGMEQDDLHVTLAYLGRASEVSMSAADITAAVTEAVEEAGATALSGQIAGLGQFPDSGDGVPSWAPVDVPGLGALREAIVARLGEAVRQDHGFTPHMTLGYDVDVSKPVPETPVTFGSVRVVYGTDVTDIPLGGGAAPAEPDDDETLSFDDEGADETKTLRDLIYATAVRNLGIGHIAAQIKAEGGADRNRGNAEELRRYWVHGEGAAKIAWGTPGDFTRCVRLVGEHMDPERAKGYCANRHKDATGMWPGDKDNTKAAAYDPSLDLDGRATEHKMEPVPAPGGKSFPHLPGTYEERIDAIRRAVSEALQGDLVDEAENRYEWNYVDIRATWDDRLIATRHKWGPVDESETFEMSYRFTADGVALGDPRPVELQIVAIADDGTEDTDVPLGDTLPLAEEIERVAFALKGAYQTVMEAKAGRVLSGANEAKLRAAVETLIHVLAAAGVRVRLVDQPEDNPEDGTDPNRVDQGTTAPSAEVKALEFSGGGQAVVLDEETVAATLRELGIE